jgi:hypothetical protein
MQKVGLKDSQAVYNTLKELGLNISVIRADDGEGFEIQIENRTGNASVGSHAGAAKKEFLATAKTFLNGKDLGNLEGSDSIISRNRKIAIKMIEKEFKKVKGVKVKTEDTTFKTSKGGAKRTIGTPKINKPTEVELAATIALPKTRRKAKRKPSPPKMALKNILGLINAKLPQQVADNMGTPRLENRTGTFAQSARAIDVQETAQGFKSIGYTYQKNPYQAFESTSGTRFSSAARDPRSLIDFSIREIVAQFGLGRLYTRRL